MLHEEPQGKTSAGPAAINCIVRDETTGTKHTFTSSATTTQKDFCDAVAAQCGYKPETFKVVFEQRDGTEVEVDCYCTSAMSKLSVDEHLTNKFFLRELDSGPPEPTGDQPVPATGSSQGGHKRAAATSVDVIGGGELKAIRTRANSDSDDDSDTDQAASSTRFVGLANQGATCYLNSLLQSLYMTPEFRNAIYKWESAASEELSIPAELQKLFLRLQTSKQRSVETTDITKSFGWEGNEAFQQHDVQELLRVLFDALEEEWQDTPLATTIKDLYEGEIHDYVSCTECGYESARTDKFMDVPLVIKPFGSEKIMTSVEEAMHKFVEVERMEGDNQYHCERCDKKVDALKGLKFKKFPYLLTLQLKRFDFDYTTLRRIKLNSRFEFPTELDVSEFMPGAQSSQQEQQLQEQQQEEQQEQQEQQPQEQQPQEQQEQQEEEQNGGNDTNTAPGSAASASTTTAATAAAAAGASDAPVNGDSEMEHEDDNNSGGDDDDDDGDTGDGDIRHDDKNHATLSSSPLTFEKLKKEKEAKRAAAVARGCVYELFSIMIHRGSALGGHYYAYIKSLDDGLWRCFNDSSVTVIKEKDIEDAFGGSQAAYGWSSTSGYMLMYRRIDPQRNQSFSTYDDLPQQLKNLSQQIEQQENQQREDQLRQERTIRFMVWNDAAEKQTVTIERTEPLSSLLNLTLEAFGIDEASKSEYRLCRYDIHRKRFLTALTDLDKPLQEMGYTNNWSTFSIGLQRANSDGTFDEYDPNALMLLLRHFDQEKKEFAPPVRVKVRMTSTLDDLLEEAVKIVGGDKDQLTLIKSDYTTRTLRPGSLSQLNFLAGGETIFSTFEDFSDEAGKMLDSDTGKELDRRRNEIPVNIVLDEDIVKGGATHSVHVDKRMSLYDFKEKYVQPLLDGLSTDDFLVFRKRVYSGTEHVTELTRLKDSLDTNYIDTYPDVLIRRGKALKPGQVKTSIYLFDSEQEEAPELFEEFPATSKGDMADFAKSVADAVRAKKESDPEWTFKDLSDDPERYRIWDATAYMRPLKVLRKTMQLPILYAGKSFLVQVLDKPDTALDIDHKVVFARRFTPSTMDLGPLEEFVVDRAGGVPALQESVSAASGIPAENLEFASTHIFPFKSDPFSLRDMRWLVPTGLYQLSCSTDGSGFYYRDKTDKMKELTEEEEEQLKRKYAQKQNKVRTWHHKEVGIVIKRKNKRTPSSSSKAESGDGDNSSDNGGDEQSSASAGVSMASSHKDSTSANGDGGEQQQCAEVAVNGTAVPVVEDTGEESDKTDDDQVFEDGDGTNGDDAAEDGSATSHGAAEVDAEPSQHLQQ
ncbi:hypothetical protein PTSG_05545 [Salpingoeca rosetta]|uniref:Ubiquitin carboxyl-terminal hydrolase 47 n=1 Tax=Salpingoeca rosetta (strain ATCC 50818 / BSB-021) TaxID=946362 RepID=F2UBI4_SALR5|nr:uncharacterized protein PTSG_05545 [Salpingoeca rosetta]EGD73850.1 hypothetical protein PTSG_05545 [Salpingoeca rosetta]|eukprot:XP_004993413.1 hypothetical protein PTSG_05545 [Salpingoeca rosetta]